MSMDWKEHDRRSGGDSADSGKSGVSPTLIAVIVVAVLILVFILQNTSKATVHFLFFDFTAGKWFALLVGQCASEYLTVELTHAARRASVSDAMGIADEGGVLSSGVRQVARKPRRKARRRFGRRF